LTDMLPRFGVGMMFAVLASGALVYERPCALPVRETGAALGPAPERNLHKAEAPARW
jgi:hypothetical protein